jgi:hypothetical protein
MIEMERPRYHPPGNGWQGRFHQIPMEIFRVDWRLKFGKIIFLNEIIEADWEFSSAYLLSGNTFPCHNGCSCHTTLRITHIEVEHNQFSIRTQKKTIDCSGGFTTGKGNSAADSSLAQAVRVKIESPGDPGSQLKGGGGAGGGKGDAGDCLDFGPLG